MLKSAIESMTTDNSLVIKNATTKNVHSDVARESRGRRECHSIELKCCSVEKRIMDIYAGNYYVRSQNNINVFYVLSQKG